jgi:hypothetical protein
MLATIDAGLYLDLAPFLDVKSGLLTRWEQQRRSSTFSTTTLFFLPSASVDRLAEAGQADATISGLAADRAGFVMTMADTVRSTRSAEVRDIRKVGTEQTERLGAEIDGARSELMRARELCKQMLTSIEGAVGPDAMANLRRSLMRESTRD